MIDARYYQHLRESMQDFLNANHRDSKEEIRALAYFLTEELNTDELAELITELSDRFNKEVNF